VLLVTGAASGIGAALARLMAPECRALLLHTRGTAEASRARLEAVADAARQAGAEVATAMGDLGEVGVGRRVVETALARFGVLDGLVANAGFADRRPVAELSRADLERSHAAMVAGFLEVAQAATQALATSGRGRLVLVSSFVAHRFRQGELFAASAAAKAGAEALARTLAIDLAPKGVTVNIVAPGYTRKDGGHTALDPAAWARVAALAPLGRIGEPEDVAHLVAFLLSERARHITGQTIAVDGGLTLA
jgi:NAD(P)-dependent dehydrogenase (short-subunit alcohol dehydrogenase family)